MSSDVDEPLRALRDEFLCEMLTQTMVMVRYIVGVLWLLNWSTSEDLLATSE